MIVPMKHLTLLCVAGAGEKTLAALRDLGCVHVDLSGASSAAFAAARRFAGTFTGPMPQPYISTRQPASLARRMLVR